ncbi:MAG: hypothetical protein AAFW70_10225 [Cyanobacteria bacterium J06635_10]
MALGYVMGARQASHVLVSTAAVVVEHPLIYKVGLQQQSQLKHQIDL